MCWVLNYVSPKDVEVLTPVPVNVILFGDDQIRIRSLWWVLFLYDWVLIKRGNLDADTCTHTGRTTI